MRPLVGSKGKKETKSLVRDDEVEIDPSSGLISILGGKWTTHRAMAEDTINAVEKYLEGTVTPSLTPHHPLSVRRDTTRTIRKGWQATFTFRLTQPVISLRNSGRSPTRFWPRR